MKRTKLYLTIIFALLLSSLSMGIQDYEIEKVISPGLDNWNHFGLAYYPVTDHFFLGRGSDGIGYLTEIDMNGDVINDRYFGDLSYTTCFVRELSYDSSTGHLFALMSTKIDDNPYVNRIWEMGTDLQTLYSDISLQEVLGTSSDNQVYSGLHVDSQGFWVTNWSNEIIHLSRNLDWIETKSTPVWITSLAASPDGGFLGMEYSSSSGEKYIHEFDSDLNHISVTGVNATFGVAITYGGLRNIETYKNKMFLSSNIEINVLSSPVPEPATLSLLALGGLTLLRRRK